MRVGGLRRSSEQHYGIMVNKYRRIAAPLLNACIDSIPRHRDFSLRLQRFSWNSTLSLTTVAGRRVREIEESGPPSKLGN